MSDPRRTCNTCEYYAAGTFDAYPSCGRHVHPVTGAPKKLCFVERLSGFDDVVAARKAAELLGACGPDGVHYRRAPQVQRQSVLARIKLWFK
jgi:hypothetical protein